MSVAGFARTAELSRGNRSYGHKVGGVCQLALSGGSLWTPNMREKGKQADVGRQLVSKKKKFNMLLAASNP